MKTFNVHEAKTQLSKLLDMADSGETVTVTRRGRRPVKLVVVENQNLAPRVAGALAHLNIDIPEELLLAPMSEDELLDWEGDGSDNPFK
jgi:prevent-host-death family protein